MSQPPTGPDADRSAISPPDRSEAPPTDRSGAILAGPVRWPIWIAMPLIFAVFLAGAVWSFREQAALARSAGFHAPALLPLTFDGFAVAMAAVAWAASLDGRAAVFARLGMAVGIACSVGANAAWAWQRSGGDRLTVILAAGVPVLAMIAFEAVLAEVRRQVQRKRGLPRPDPIPMPRLIAVVLSPFKTPRLWRRLVLDLTDLTRQFEAVRTAQSDTPAARAEQTEPTGPPAPLRPVPDRSRTGATVTSINRSGPGRPTSRQATRSSRLGGRRTGRRGSKATGHSPVALADAEAVLDRYGDRIPARDQVRREMGWGSPKASNALKAVAAARAARRGQSDTSNSQEAP